MDFGISLIPLLLLFGYGQARPHQVHNLLLYPNKHAWCTTKDINMVITHKGCTPQSFTNKVCVGQCFSYFTPRTNPPNQVEEKLKYCDQCKPSNSTWQQVTLDCDMSHGYATFTKEVEIIYECACSACEATKEDSKVTGHHGNDDRSLTDQYEAQYEEDGSREEYMEETREKLAAEHEEIIASREELEKHKDLDARNSWLKDQYEARVGRRKHQP